MDTQIKDINAIQILDSRGNPTLSVKVTLYNGIKASVSVPSGASVGHLEAYELRDNNKNLYNGKSVLNAVKNVNEIISNRLNSMCTLRQRDIDKTLIELDGTENKSNLGANAILGVSLACAKAGALALKLPLYKYIGGINADILPVPMINIINGGIHADNNLDFQEFMITPSGASDFEEAIKMAQETFFALKSILKKSGKSTLVGDEGGFAPDLKSNREALDIIIEAIIKAGYTTNLIKICLDIAASGLYQEETYNIKCENLSLGREEMAEYLKNLVEDYPIVSIEDGMAENDYQGWRMLTDAAGKKVLLVGDDLFVTNKKLLLEGIRSKIANSILIKLNQIGTLTETLETVRLAQRAGYKTIISHRSGETEDTFISDLAVGLNAGFIKAGSLSRSERTAKYNRLIKIESELKGEYPGAAAYVQDYGENFGGCARKC